jgi:CheY-like chemotaxis protein
MRLSMARRGAMIRTHARDGVILDWEMPGLIGTSFVRMVRSPKTIPLPDTPTIMLTGHGER